MLNPPGPEILDQLSNMLGPRGIILGEDPAAHPYLLEPRDRWQGIAGAIVRPKSTSEVSVGTDGVNETIRSFPMQQKIMSFLENIRAA